MEVTGILIKKTGEREGVSSKSGLLWKMAEYLVEVPGQYPRHINFRVSDGQVGRLSRFDSLMGKTVTVSFDIDAHEYEGRWFNELNAWGIMEYVNSTQRQANMAAVQQQKPAGESAGTTAQPTQQAQAGAVPPFQEPGQQQDGNGDDLPF